MIFEGSTFDFAFVRVILGFSMLTLATYFDLKKREVHDSLWLIFAGLAIVLIFFESSDTAVLIQTGLSTSIIVPTAFILWRLGIFAGADAFAIMILSALVPFATFSGENITPFTTLTNAGFLAMSMIVLNASKNLKDVIKGDDIFYGFNESRIRKIMAFFIGIRAKNPQYSFSIQRWDGASKKLNFSLNHAEKSEFCNTPFTWVTPGIPFILYISLGFVVQIFFGDILLSALQSFVIL